jgi:hypothetical protein
VCEERENGGSSRERREMTADGTTGTRKDRSGKEWKAGWWWKGTKIERI